MGLITSRVPPLDLRLAGALLAADAYVYVIFWRLGGRLRQKDVRAHERVASV